RSRRFGRGQCARHCSHAGRTARVLPARVVTGLVELYHALLRNDEALAAKAYAHWGFADVT
ncbi:MAG: hypothetical protein ABMA01_05385, partial [Chthoniobacteraceae bacterium]